MFNQMLHEESRRILGPFKVSSEAIDRLVRTYSEQWRTYHNSERTLEMLRRSRNPEIILNGEARQRLELMILYRYAWYKVGRSSRTNESKSAAWLDADLTKNGATGTESIARPIREGILATVKYTLDGIRAEFKNETGTLLDLDLVCLAHSSVRFRQDVENIWLEHEPIFTRAEFDTCYSAWARSFLKARTRIYHTEPFYHLEERARQNLEALANQ